MNIKSIIYTLTILGNALLQRWQIMITMTKFDVFSIVLHLIMRKCAYQMQADR